MIKKIALLLLVTFVLSCSSSKPVARSNSKTKNKTVAVKKKPTVVVSSPKPTVTITTIPTETRNEVQLEATSNVRTYDDEIRFYIADFSEIAKNNMRTHGIPASITLAQGILESGAGKGKLAQSANNHFGIKCHTGWTGESVKHDDDSAQECFRKYNHPSESYRDHSLFLTSRSRYASLFKLDKGDYQAWAKGLKAAGYATDVKYPAKLIGIIERFDLFKYDNEVLTRDFTPNKKGSVVDLPAGNYTVEKGDTLYSLSRKFNISVAELKNMNNLSYNAISVGQKLRTK